MRRREFITLVGAAAATCPLSVRGQPSIKLPTIGFLGPATRSSQSRVLDAFLGRLRDLGWIGGKNLAIEYRFAEGRPDRYAEIAAEFVRLKVDIIVTSTTGPTIAAMRATSTIAIVFASALDPVGHGLVSSLARPGGNVTGNSFDVTDDAGRHGLTGKRIEILRAVIPGLRRLGIMANIDNFSMRQTVDDAQDAVNAFGIHLITFPIRNTEDITPAIDTAKGEADALIVPIDPVVFSDRIRIGTLAIAARLPTLMSIREQVEAGGLMSYGTNLPDQYRRAADIVDQILHGTKPGDIPVAQPTTFELIVNLTTAKALGLTMPESFLLLADEVIE